jgi:hypothetical protein
MTNARLVFAAQPLTTGARILQSQHRLEGDEMKPMNERLLRVAQCGFVTLNDPHVIADAQQRIDSLTDLLRQHDCNVDGLRSVGECVDNTG